MRDELTLEVVRRSMVRQWLLAILRFALTLDPTDRADVLTLAKILDRPVSLGRETDFNFFDRMSTEFCEAIADRHYPNRLAILRRHLKRIDDRRLRQALQMAIDFEPVTLRPRPPDGELQMRSAAPNAGGAYLATAREILAARAIGWPPPERSEIRKHV
jgi:hypothetical protein